MEIQCEKKFKTKIGDNAIEVIIPPDTSDEDVCVSIFDYDDFCVTTILVCSDGLREFISNLLREL